MTDIVLLFPGQGSQKPGMGKDLADAFPEARSVFEQADAALGVPLSKLCFDGPAEELTLTHNAETSAPAPACGLSFMAATYPESIWLEAGQSLMRAFGKARSSCSCLGGDTDSRAYVIVDTLSLVTGAKDAMLRTALLNVRATAPDSSTSIVRDSDQSGGAFDGGGDGDGNSETNAANKVDRHIDWEATTILLGEPNFDVDVVVEGDAIALARAVADKLDGRVRAHRKFGTAVVLYGENERLDLVTARSETKCPFPATAVTPSARARGARAGRSGSP